MPIDSTATPASACATSIRCCSTRCVFEAAEKYAPAEQAPPLVWSSAGWSGSQRLPVQWSGETQSDWEGLAASIRATLSNGMSGGRAIYACEVGGGYAARRVAELFVRWLQAGVFASHLRLRANDARGPWVLDQDQEKIALQWLEFRYGCSAPTSAPSWRRRPRQACRSCARCRLRSRATR